MLHSVGHFMGFGESHFKVYTCPHSVCVCVGGLYIDSCIIIMTLHQTSKADFTKCLKDCHCQAIG